MTRINESEIFNKSIYHANVNVNAIQIKSETTINIDMNAKSEENILCAISLITILLLTIVGIYHYYNYKKHWLKRKTNISILP